MVIEEKIQRDILAFCENNFKKDNILSICLYGSRVSGYARKDSDFDILLVLEEFSKEVLYYYKKMNNIQLSILAVSREIIEQDAKTGAFGDFVVGRLLSPNIKIKNIDYIDKIEFETKRRFIKEDLKDLILEFGGLSRGLSISPEYFILVRMKKRIRAYPPLRYSYTKMLSDELKNRNMKLILRSYQRVFDDLSKNDFIIKENGRICPSNNYVDSILSSKIINKFLANFNFGKKTLYSYLTHGKAGKVGINVVAKEIASKLTRSLQGNEKNELEDPKNYLFLKTDRDLISLSDKSSVISLIRKIKNTENISMEPLASALNEVYVVDIEGEKLVFKKFTDLFNLKWFFLNLATIGTKTFTLSGRERLSNEYGMSLFLRNKGIQVPEIIYVNPSERHLIRQFIEGEQIQNIIKEEIHLNTPSNRIKNQFFNLGMFISKVHKLDIALGDCKPENFILGKDERLYIVDLEQAEKGGDKIWDVAEFLYFTGHYAKQMTPGLTGLIQNFINGYILNGDSQILRSSSMLKYYRVFLIWTNLHILQGIAELLRNI